MFRTGSAGPILFLCGMVMINLWLLAPVYGISRQSAPADTIAIFKEELSDTLSTLEYHDELQSFYEKNNYQTVLLNRFLRNGELAYLLSDLESVADHGLDPEIFRASSFRLLMEGINREKSFKDLDAYRKKVKLELLTAYAVLKYSRIMEFGLIEPQIVDSNYFSVTVTADSTFLTRVLELREVRNYLDSIQPRGKVYKAFQFALKSDELAPGKTLEETKSVLSVNMERLRWKNKPTEPKYVMVNLANFSLDVIDQEESVLNMKVCVGEPGRWASPQLNSKIYSVQVNPVWNIPVSIAKSETVRNAKRDRYYLANNNIAVYKDGKRIGNPSAIDWTINNAEDYVFKQMPGESNALGKIKFLFNNDCGVYLHDTPLKLEFKKKNRSISHGCIRLEKPMELASILFGEGAKYEQIRKAMLNGYPRAKYIGLPQSVPITLTYFTAFTDDTGDVVYCKDIYGLDEVLSARLIAGR
jgi:murein L,D-transpeptidase YcbB/YkuD